MGLRKLPEVHREAIHTNRENLQWNEKDYVVSIEEIYKGYATKTNDRMNIVCII